MSEEKDLIDDAISVEAKVQRLRGQVEAARALVALDHETAELAVKLVSAAERTLQLEKEASAQRAVGRTAFLTRPSFPWGRAGAAWLLSLLLAVGWTVASLLSLASPGGAPRSAGQYQYYPVPLSFFLEPKLLRGPPGEKGCLPNMGHTSEGC